MFIGATALERQIEYAGKEQVEKLSTEVAASRNDLARLIPILKTSEQLSEEEENKLGEKPEPTILEVHLNNENSLEERVDTLETQMTSVNKKLSIITGDIQDLDHQVSNIETLTGSVNDIDARLSKLELDGTMGFHVGISAFNPIIPKRSVVIFDAVNVNIGGGYNSSTGLFTVPSGGAGLFYFDVHFIFGYGEYADMYIRKNGIRLCRAHGNSLKFPIFPHSSCGAVTSLEEGTKLFTKLTVFNRFLIAVLITTTAIAEFQTYNFHVHFTNRLVYREGVCGIKYIYHYYICKSTLESTMLAL